MMPLWAQEATERTGNESNESSEGPQDISISVNELTNVGVEELLVASLALLQFQLHLDVFPAGHQNRVLVVGLLHPVQGLHHGCDLKTQHGIGLTAPRLLTAVATIRRTYLHV